MKTKELSLTLFRNMHQLMISAIILCMSCILDAMLMNGKNMEQSCSICIGIESSKQLKGRQYV